MESYINNSPYFIFQPRRISAYNKALQGTAFLQII